KGISENNNRSNEDSSLDTVDNIEKSIIKRRKEDSERYLTLYGIRQDEEKNYDAVIDTTDLTIEEVFFKVMNLIESRK
ncbi:MAG: hypothetical protein UT03_C0023G0001, partial [Candidatus Moranbacteria bacterium GW2011_GWD2_38_7]